MKKYVIFDWNGTIIDDTQFTVNIENTMMKKRNMPPVSIERYREVFDFPVINYYHALGWDFTDEPFETVSEEFINTFNRGFLSCPLVKNAENVLTTLKNSGVTLILLSATREDYFIEQVKGFGLDGYFDTIIGTDTIHAHGKVERALEWLKTSDIDKTQTIMIGDSVHDAEVADALGVDGVLITTGHMSEKRLISTGKPVINDLNELLKIVL